MTKTVLRVVKRMVGNLYVGSNVKQRPQLGENYLSGTKIVALHGCKNIGIVARILKDQGAEVSEFRYDSGCLTQISKAVGEADIFLDGAQRGGVIEEAAASNPRLIVAECDCDEPFSAMSAVARIAMAMTVRDKNGFGQQLIASDCLDYWKHLNRSSRK